jgi:hypothetical protein
MLARAACILAAAAALLADAVATAANVPVAPEAWPQSRYERLRQESPFDVATAEEKSDEPPPIPWTEGLFISSLAKMMREGVEVDYLIVRNSKDPGVFTIIESGKPNDLGIELVKLESSDNPSKTVATVKKGAEFGTLKFDATAFTASAAPPASAGRTGPQGVPIPGAGAIPRPAGATQPGVNPSANPSGIDTRRRVRVINSQQGN